MKNTDSFSEPSLLTVGQMAKLCGTTKATLYHYDQMGLLKPARMGENGYRYYEIHQVYSFDVIQTLKMHDLSLQEIQGYLQMRSPSAFVQLLRANVQHLDSLVADILWKRDLAQNTIVHTERIAGYVLGQPSLRTFPQRRYLQTPSQGNPAKALVLHHQRRHQGRASLDLAVHGLIAAGAYESGRPSLSYLCSQVRPEAEGEDFCILPPGEYGVLRCNGSNQDQIFAGIDTLLKYLQSLGRTPKGPLLVEDIINGMINMDHKDCTVAISVQAD